MIRAFLALPVPPDIQEALEIQQDLLPLPRCADPDQFHITTSFWATPPIGCWRRRMTVLPPCAAPVLP